ncbi:MAG: hypothetical protein ACYDH2_04080 [Anaerolineaceae bacterium]
MLIGKYIDNVNLFEKTEIEKVKLLAYFLFKTTNENNFDLTLIINILNEIGHPISNISRLKRNLSKSKDFKKGTKQSTYLLTPITKKDIETEFGSLFNNTYEIISSSEVIDEVIFLGKRGFLDKLIKQINNCFDNNCYDACAVLMRRVFEITLILAFEHHGIQNQIKDTNGNYYFLEKIVDIAVSNITLKLSRSKKEYLDIKELGNFAAHKIYFNVSKKDIDDIKQIYRVCLEELFYKAGL